MKLTIETTPERANEGIEMILKAGGSFNSGHFSIKGVKGMALYSNNLLQITITDKPWLASWGMIEDKIREFFC